MFFNDSLSFPLQLGVLSLKDAPRRGQWALYFHSIGSLLSFMKLLHQTNAVVEIELKMDPRRNETDQ